MFCLFTYSLLLAEEPLTGRCSCHGGLTLRQAITNAAVGEEPSLALLLLLFSCINDRYQPSRSHSLDAGRVHAASPLLHEPRQPSMVGGAVITKDRCMITSGNSCAFKPNWQCWGNYSESLPVWRDALSAPVTDLPARLPSRGLTACRPPQDCAVMFVCRAPPPRVSPRPCRHWQAPSVWWWGKMFTAAAQRARKMFILVWTSKTFWSWSLSFRFLLFLTTNIFF